MRSIKGKMLLWFSLAMVILLSILGTVTYVQIRDTVIPLTKELTKEVLVARSSEMNKLIEGYKSEVRTLSQQRFVRSGDFDIIKNELITFEKDINPDYEMLFYANLNGDFITTSNLEGNISDRDYFQAIIRGEEDSFINNPVISRSTGESIFVVAHSVYNEKGNKVGLIAATVLLETLSDIAGEISIGESGFGYIVDQNGLLIAHPRDDLRMSLNLLESRELGYEGLVEIGQSMVNGNSEVLNYQRPDGDKLVTAFNPIPSTPSWSLGISLYEEELMGQATGLMQNIIFLMAAVIIVVLVLVFYISTRISKPILDLKEGVNTVSDGDLDHILTIKTNDEIEELAEAYNKMTTDLKEYIYNLQKTTAQKERIESELMVANKIQARMLPSIFPPYPNIENLELFASMEPAREVGGDFYDFFLLDDHRFCFCIGDVSGKGVPAALFMVITRTILRNQVLHGNSLTEVFFRTNNLLCSDNIEDMFVTVFMGIVNTNTGELEYINAGHNPPLISRKDKDYEFLHVNRNLVLGGFEDFDFKSQKIVISQGDILFLYTDGLNEAMNHQQEEFGNERMFKAINKTKKMDVKDVIGKLEEEVNSFIGETPASDDLTMLALTLRVD